MLKIVIIYLILFTSGLYATAQNYNVGNIPAELKTGALAVIRANSVEFTVFDTAKAEMRSHLVITVLSRQGDHMANFIEGYDKFSKITDVSGKLYNGEGKLLKKFKSGDFVDNSATTSSNLFDDNRAIIFQPMVNVYPYTIEYEWVIKYSGLLNYPGWRPQERYDMSVENSDFKVTVPKGFPIRFKQVNWNENPEITEDIKMGTSYFFKAKNLQVVEPEFLSTGRDVVPLVYSIPGWFKLDGYTGANKDWKTLGNWFWQLNQQENKLSEKTLAELKDLKSKSKDSYELIKNVYQYMQSKTRYVSIQLGIGGQKPFDASVVDKYGYGDCKALVNYTHVLLKNVGVESIYTLVHAGENANEIVTDETFDQFNHIILCVPVQKDTLWLECTNQAKPFGFQGSFTDNRHVLLISAGGGKLVKTHTYLDTENQLIRTAKVQLLSDGTAEAGVQTKYTGLQYDDMEEILNEPGDKQKEKLYQQIQLPTFTIKNFTINQEKLRIPSLSENITLSATKYATTMGNRLLFPINMLNKTLPIANNPKERKTEFRLRYAYCDYDSITYNYPEGYKVEFSPATGILNSDFGSYESSCKVDATKHSITYARKRCQKAGIFPPDRFKDYVSFIKSISLQDNAKITLVKETP